MRQRIVVTWPPSSVHGWGVYGLNLGLAWAGDGDLEPVFSAPIDRRDIVLDALRKMAIRPVLAASDALRRELGPLRPGRRRLALPLLRALDNHAVWAAGANGKREELLGRPTLGVAFIETSAIDPEAARFLAGEMPVVIAGSSWNRDILRAAGIAAATVLQGVDLSLFHPAPRHRMLGRRFLVFSGGKLELRKGQDLVLLAFRAFAQRHPEALLVTAWHSPWRGLAGRLRFDGPLVPPRARPDGAVDVAGWLVDNGVPLGQVLDLGQVANLLLAPVLREMDVALFPNRCEGGTNLVAMECMACGVPTILSANTGHLDLIAADRCLPLSRQAAIAGPAPGGLATEGWGASDVEEIVEALELVWRDRARAGAIGAGGAAFMRGLGWSRQIARLKATILPHL
jgi:glycosyltransferase involved in cell wall biosynthesis